MAKSFARRPNFGYALRVQRRRRFNVYNDTGPVDFNPFARWSSGMKFAEVSVARNDQDVVEVTPRTQIRRFPLRGHYDKSTIWGILDKAIVAHLGFSKDATPAMLPMVFFRKDNYVYFHGAQKNRMFGSFKQDPKVCFTATVIDGFVAARAALHHSMNYRSVVIYGTVEQVDDAAEKFNALKGLIERFYPNRWNKIRPPSESELSRVSVYRLPIQEASAKIRNAFPAPVPDELEMNVWAGVIPLETRLGMPVLDAHSNPDTSLNQDFSRIAEILRPFDGANEPGPSTPEYNPVMELAPPERPQAMAQVVTPAPPALVRGKIKPVGMTFALADGSTQSVTGNVGTTVMQAATAAGVPGIVAECGGSMACATCHVYVDPAWTNRLPPAGAGEQAMLDFVEGGRREGSRLSCQITVVEAMEGFHATIPERQR